MIDKERKAKKKRFIFVFKYFLGTLKPLPQNLEEDSGSPILLQPNLA